MKLLTKTSMTKDHSDSGPAIWLIMCRNLETLKAELTESSSNFCSSPTAKVVQQGLEVFNFPRYGCSKYLFPIGQKIRS